jgi:hypothetical protein
MAACRVAAGWAGWICKKAGPKPSAVITFEWTELACQQQEQGAPTLLVVGAAALFVLLGFILGVALLAVATGAGAEMRQSLGTQGEFQRNRAGAGPAAENSCFSRRQPLPLSGWQSTSVCEKLFPLNKRGSCSAFDNA